VSIDEAPMPRVPSSPAPALLLAVGGVLGLGIGLIGASVRRTISGRILDSVDAERISGAPVLAEVAAERYGSSASVRRRDAARPPASTRSVERATPVSGFRAVRDVLDSAAVSCVVVASPGERQTAARVAALLAEQYAAAGRRVIVIDADFGHRPLSIWAALTDAPGLADVIAGRTGLDAAISVAPGRAYAVLPSGGRQGLEDVLAMRAAKTTFDQLARRFDHVIVAVPSVLEGGDAALATALVGHVIVPVTARRERRATLARAVSMLHASGTRLDGIVLLRGVLAEPLVTPPASDDDTPKPALGESVEDDVLEELHLQLPLRSLSLRFPFAEALDRGDRADRTD
jgi:tyrosine-protein kinase Etk/Wzc